MSNKLKKHLIFTALLAIILVLAYPTTAMADSHTTAPNPGGPITVDGDYSDWDLVADFYADLLRASGNPGPDKPVEAKSYLRVDFSTNTMYLLVRTEASSPNIMTSNLDDIFVKIDGSKPVINDFAWVNQQGKYAEGYEASFPIDQGSFTIQVHTMVDNEGPQTAGTGEVPIEIYRWDYGDLPDTYGTKEGSNGPKHFGGTCRLGILLDGEADGQPSDSVLEDDITAKSDEDGVIPIGNWANLDTLVFQYMVNGCPEDSLLNAWADWNKDGVFDDDTENILRNKNVSNGTATHSFQKSGTITDVNIRFRLCEPQETCNTPTGNPEVSKGEVEDYQWTFVPNAIALNDFTATPINNTTTLYVVAGLAAAILFTSSIAFLIRRKKQAVDL